MYDIEIETVDQLLELLEKKKIFVCTSNTRVADLNKQTQMEEEYKEEIKSRDEKISTLLATIEKLSNTIMSYGETSESNKEDINNVKIRLNNISEKINQRTNNGNLDLSEEDMANLSAEINNISAKVGVLYEERFRNTNVRDFGNPQTQYYQQPFQQQYFQQVPVQPVQQFSITEGQLRNILNDSFEKFYRDNGYLYTLKQDNEYKEQQINAFLKKLDDTISKIPDVLNNGLKKQTNENIETREARDISQNLTELKNTIGNFIENYASAQFRNTNVNGNELQQLIEEIKKAIVINREVANMNVVDQAVQNVTSNSNLGDNEKYEQIYKIVLANEDTRNKLLSEQSERLLQMHSTDIEMLKEMFDSLRKDSAGMINYIGNLSQEYNKSTERIVNSTFSQINQITGQITSQITQSFGQAFYGLGQMVAQLSNSVFALANSTNNLVLENQKQTQGTKLLEPGINATSAEVTKKGDTRVKDLDEKAPKSTRSSKEEKPKKSKKKAQDETYENVFNIALSSRMQQSNNAMRGSMIQAATILHLANEGYIENKRLGEIYKSAEGSIVAGYNLADKIEEKVTEDVANMMINIQRNTNTRVVPAIQQGQTSIIPAIDEPVRNVQYVTYVPQATPQVIQQPIGQPVAVQNVSNASGVYYLQYPQLTTTNIPPNAAQIAQQVLPTTLSTPTAPSLVNGANVIQMPYAPIQQNQYAKQ